jgi:hypothetical protein
MPTPREAVLVAQELFLKMGASGVETAESRAAGALGCGDPETANFWSRVARAMSLMARAPSTVRAVAQEGARGCRSHIWPLMQRIEGFRHLASEAEGQARTTACEASAGHFLSIAAGWRELTADLEQLASAAFLNSVKYDASPEDIVGRLQPHLQVARIEFADRP